ncbi:MAG: type IV secretion system DNA-binding domain-containing protein [Acidobacteria bacterium]|nr:type IV secretion system DNA-binding domain-containing protein [Acidobacteriota bacterium]
MSLNPAISYFGVTNGRLPHQAFGIKQADRLFHMYLLGRSGVGKTTMLETIALQDIGHGRGIAVIDPHGDLAESLVQQVPDWRKDDLVYLNAADPTQSYGYNPLRGVRADRIPLAASGLMEAFKKLWDEAWGVRMEHVLRQALYALIEYGQATLPDVLRILTDKSFRYAVLAKVKNDQVRAFWTKEFKEYNPRYRQESIAPIQNKIGAFLADPRLYRMLTAPPIDLHFRKLMDEGKILIVNLAKGRLGADSANLIGALLVTTLSLAAFSRADVDESKRPDYFILIDEFQSYTTLSVAIMVSELRKYHVGLVLAHQHLHQLEPAVQHAVLGNAGTLISFRIGPEDARVMAREFEPVFSPEDLVNLPNHSLYVKLMIDGAPSRPFSANTLRPMDLERANQSGS